jgi:hypothetical protein
MSDLDINVDAERTVAILFADLPPPLSGTPFVMTACVKQRGLGPAPPFLFPPSFAEAALFGGWRRGSGDR